MNKVAVTGGAGFLGSHVVGKLLGKNYSVNVIDDFSNGKIAHLQNLRSDPRLKIYKGDIRNPEDVKAAFTGCSIVIHLAVLDLRQSIKEPLKVNDVVVNGTLVCLNAALKNNVELFVNCSSSEVYGSAVYTPMDELHPLLPETPYAAAKTAQDMYTASFGRTYGLPWVTIRPFNMYGPNSHWQGFRGELIPKMIVRAMNKVPLMIFGEGLQTRDFVYVEECAGAIINIIENNSFRNESVNFCSKKETSVRQIAEYICSHFSLDPAQYIVHQACRPGDVQRHLGDNSKFAGIFGFVPQTDIEEGLLKTIEWFRSLKKEPSEFLENEVIRNWE